MKAKLFLSKSSTWACLTLAGSLFLLPAGQAQETITLDPDLKDYKPASGISGNLTSIGSDTLNNLRGRIWIDGQEVFHPDMDAIDLRKKVGMVFQKSNPFPKSIYENTAYGLRVAGIKDKRP